MQSLQNPGELNSIELDKLRIFFWVLSFKRRLRNLTSKCCFPQLEKVQMNPANLFCFFTNPTRIECFPMTSQRPHLCPKTIKLHHVELLTKILFVPNIFAQMVAAWIKTLYLLVGRWLVEILVKYRTGKGKRENEKWEENLSTSHERSFDRLKNLTGHFVHTKNKIFSLYTRKIFHNLRARPPIQFWTRERESEWRSREGPRKEEHETVSHKLSFVLTPDEGK